MKSTIETKQLDVTEVIAAGDPCETKKITDLLELLDKQDPKYQLAVFAFHADGYGCIGKSNADFMFEWGKVEDCQKQLTACWNSLTGEELKNVTWVI